ncbi:MAG: ABC transporter ATP-binding protein [Rhodospirillales bacterium]|nr:MAG: ABC transporter ATP-binding protein [Rhodospirillales bacterium]
MNEAVFRAEGIVRTYRQGRKELQILRGLDLAVQAGEIVALVGPSGAGKSTLLHVAGLLERPDAGEVLIDGQACGGLGDAGRTRIRRSSIGFVYQYHHLLPEFSAVENIAIPQIIAGRSRREATERSRELLKCLGLEDRATHRPGRLSGGEQQRVAIGRALANVPKVLLADEPTGNLDPHTADEVFHMLLALVRSAGLAAVVATHNVALAERMDRIVLLEDGVLVPVEP